MKPQQSNIAIIGIGYVGLPLAMEFAKQYPTTGFDIKHSRIDELKAGRDSMADHVADKLVRKMSEKGISVVGANILIMGITFKENCPDTRNSQVFRVIEQLKSMNANVDATDPWVEGDEAAGLGLVNPAEAGGYDAIVVAVAHRQFVGMGIEAIRALGKKQCVVFDLKYLFDQEQTDVRL
jgi:UDP-N-acetyl-D-galactosamine dehydrogenase